MDANESSKSMIDTADTTDTIDMIGWLDAILGLYSIEEQCESQDDLKALELGISS